MSEVKIKENFKLLGEFVRKIVDLKDRLNDFSPNNEIQIPIVIGKIVAHEPALHFAEQFGIPVQGNAIIFKILELADFAKTFAQIEELKKALSEYIQKEL